MAKKKSGSHRTEDQRPDESGAAVTDKPASAEVESAKAAVETKPSFAVVGIGASAGGLDAFKQFFIAMPADSGLAFVLIQHLAPDHVSLTDELLAKHTQMPVVQVTDGMRVEPNHVYVIPPNTSLAISGGTLHLTEPSERRGLRTPIDFFFRSLADDQQERAIGIVLTGTGSDGTQGVRETKATGGIVMAQLPETAQHDGMPRSAIATGMVDYILPIDQMPYCLRRYLEHQQVNGGDEQPTQDGKARDQMHAIVNLIRVRLKYDFSCYKKGTLNRRVQRRMGINHIAKISDYVECLRKNENEVRALYKDLLISVTNFFREPEAWSELEQHVIEPLVRAHPGDGPIRVWTPGCATGEEPYSLAMMLIENLQKIERSCGLQMFASDIDQDALAFARAGVYRENIDADVSAERLRRFFMKGEQTYLINKELRDAIVFADQNLVSNPPFSKMDLISCRNLLIYLEPEIQKKVFSLFHFALNKGGYLFLGSSETVTVRPDLFEPVSRKWRIYRRIGSRQLDTLDLPARPTILPRSIPPVGGELGEVRVRRVAALAQHLMLQRFAPACVLVNREAEVHFLNGAVEDFLQLPKGEFATNLFAMAREGLRTKLRATLHQAIQHDRPIIADGVRVKRDGKSILVRLIVEPLQQPKEVAGLFLIRFETEGSSTALSPLPQSELSGRQTEQAEATPPGDHEPTIRRLEDELRVSNEDLQSTIEELETSNEEFKAANEEVTSVNEELQSTNEELEISKEELQSLNEELQTVNTQLEHKIAELETTNNDLANLMTSTDIAIIFLDQKLRIKRFTPAAMRLMRVIETDLGRSIGDLTTNFTDDDLLGDAKTVLQRLIPIEKEVHDDQQLFYLRRIVPYRTHDNRIDGVVITFVEITQQKQSEQLLRDSEQRNRTVVEGSPDGIVVQQDSRIVYANPTLVSMFGYATAEELIGRLNLETLAAPEERFALRTRIEDCARGERVPPHLGWRALKQDGAEIWVASNATLIPWEGRPAVLAFCADVTEVQHTAGILREAQLRQRSIIDAAIDAVIQMDQVGRITDFNVAAERIFGHARADAMGKSLAELIIPPALRDSHYRGLAHFLATGEGPVLGKLLEISALRADGSEFPVELSIESIPGAVPPAFTGFLRDITERKRDEADLKSLNFKLEERVSQRTEELQSANAALRESEERFRTLIESAPDAMVVCDESGLIVQVNQRTEQLFGYLREDLLGHSVEWLVPSHLSKVHREHRAKFFKSPSLRNMGTVIGMHKGGEQIPVEIQLSPMMLGDRLLVIASVRDMRERQQAREVQARFGAVMENSPAAIVMLGMDLTITHWNWGAERLLGYQAKEVVGKNIAILLPPDRSRDYQEILERLTKASKIEDYETVRRHKDGSRIDVALTASLLKDESGRTVGINVIQHDIRERKRLEQQIAEVADTERQYWSRELHDSLGQEVSGIGMLAASLRQQLPGESPQAKLAAQLETTIDRTKQNLRRFAKGLFPVAVDGSGLSVALRELAKEISHVYKLDCRFECPEEIPLEDNFSATQLYMITREATHNAAKHAKPQQVVIRLEDHDGVRVSIQDNGQGLPQKLDERATLGLRIIRHRCGLIGASLQIESPPAGGTLISCRIPEPREQ